MKKIFFLGLFAFLTLNLSAQCVNCFGGIKTLTATPTSGTAPYTYAWSGGGTSATKVISAGGTYTVTVTDANSCSSTASYTAIQNTEISLTLTPTNGACSGTGAISSVTTGGTPSYTYLWSNAATTANISSLTTGSYTLTVTDASGCTKSATTTITNGAGSSVTISCG